MVTRLRTARKRDCFLGGALLILLSAVLYSQDLLHRLGRIGDFALTKTSLKPVSIGQYIERQSPIAKANILANIGPDGSKCSGAKPGVVIASPSTSEPDYLYTWTRDSALVFKYLINEYTTGKEKSLSRSIEDFISSQSKLQQIANPSGNISTGGLGEPKFNINLTAFTDSWGRPQHDGPPLRGITLISYCIWLIENSQIALVKKTIWPVIKRDLDYTAAHWNRTGFDLWEEVSSSSFFTTAIQHRALREGAALAATLDYNSLADEYTTQGDNALCFLQTYWNSEQNYITANTGGGRTGKDANSVLASIHTFDPAAGCDPVTFQPCSDKALANHKAYVDAFRNIYPINRHAKPNAAVATGRYPEDVYYEGQAWYLATAAAAEQLYDALIVWQSMKFLTVTNISLEFFRQFSSSVEPGTYDLSSATYKTLTAAIKNYSDGFLLINANYTPADGSMAEQYSRINGTAISAKDLTWSYASTLTAFASRQGLVPFSWGAKDLSVPSVCVGNSGPMVQITFNVVAEAIWGENIYLAGSINELNNWTSDNAILLSSVGYPTWSITIYVPGNTHFEYKYLRKASGSITWESDPNRVFSSPPSGKLVINDDWR